MEEEVNLTFHLRYQMESVVSLLGEISHRPILPVRLSYGEESLDTNALIDSGADYSAFPLAFTKVLKIPYTDLKRIPNEIETAKGSPGWLYGEINIMLVGLSFTCKTVFLDDPDWFPVIGREPIFSHLKVAFRQSLGEFYISLRP